STSEINNVFGDNDRMSAYVASKIDADLLVLLTDIDGVYTGNPKTDPSAVRLTEIDEITDEIFGYAKGAGSTFSTGGMRTKLLAAQIAQKGGCGTLIISGYEKDSLVRAISGEEIGTYILPEKRLAQRQRWILNTASSGSVTVDSGAENALTVGHKSLLPSGITNVTGVFNEGDVIDVVSTNGNVILKAVTSFNSSDLLRIMGHKTKDISKILGDVPKVVFRPEDAIYI
ncbi:MAG: glutamate 5-kinase, partial [Spirochaetales bacterium]|nr:glutamate 5-kinase [Spirochaetales bacterium]